MRTENLTGTVSVGINQYIVPLKYYKMFSEKELKESQEFKDWVDGRVALIHNTYRGAKQPY